MIQQINDDVNRNKCLFFIFLYGLSDIMESAKMKIKKISYL